MLKNGSLWADIFLARNGTNPDPRNSAFDPALVHHVRKRMFLYFSFPYAILLIFSTVLTPYLPRIKFRKENLKNCSIRRMSNRYVELKYSFWQSDVIAPHWHPAFSSFYIALLWSLVIPNVSETQKSLLFLSTLTTRNLKDEACDNVNWVSWYDSNRVANLE